MSENEKNQNKILVPTYEMETTDYYFLLKLTIGLTDRQKIGAINKDFYNVTSEASAKKSLERLEKSKYIDTEDGNININTSLKQQLEVVADSLFASTFVNSAIEKTKSSMMFYFADKIFVGVLSNKDKTTISSHKTIEGVMAPFEKQLMSKGLLSDFDIAKWHQSTEGKFAEPIQKAAANFTMVMVGNVMYRPRFTVSAVTNKEIIHIVRGIDGSTLEDVGCDAAEINDYYGVIFNELVRLKKDSRIFAAARDSGDDNDGGESDKTQKKKRKNKKVDESAYSLQGSKKQVLSDYDQIVGSKGFPKSGWGLLPYILINSIKMLPRTIVNMFTKNIMSLIFLAISSILLFMYNLFATCYINDTFMFDRQAVWGNLTPYLMSGTIQTPNKLYGFDINVGNISNVYIVAPLFLILSFIGRLLWSYFKTNKMRTIPNVISSIPKIIMSQVKGVVTGKSTWVIYACAFTISFIIMNPLSVFALGILCLIIYLQGKNNLVLQATMVCLCAINRKKIDNGLLPKPSYHSAACHVGVWAEGFLIYSCVNLLLWNFLQYSFYIRALTTVLLVLFCFLQIAIGNSKKIKNVVACLLVLCFTCLLISAPMLTMLADDGGWKESGSTIVGLLANAGFGLILGASMATIGVFATGAIGTALIYGGIAAGLTVAGVGAVEVLTGNSYGYFTKSSMQYFFGLEDGEVKTVLCSVTQGLDLIASVLSLKGVPKEVLTNYGLLVVNRMLAAKDLAVLAGDTANLGLSIQENGLLSWDTALAGLSVAFDGLALQGSFDDYVDAIGKYYKSGDHVQAGSNVIDKMVDEFKNLNKVADNVMSEFDDANKIVTNTYNAKVSELQNKLVDLDVNSSYYTPAHSAASRSSISDQINKLNIDYVEELAQNTDALNETLSAIENSKFEYIKANAEDIAAHVNDWYVAHCKQQNSFEIVGSDD